MALDMTETEISASTIYDGDEEFTLAAGKTLKIESTPDGEEHFNDTVPAGKQWSVRAFIRIVETDV